MMMKIGYAKLLIDDSEITYLVRSSNKAKYLQLRINQKNQLELIIPKRYSLKDGEKFINEKIDWINKYRTKLQKEEKNSYLFLGERIKVEQNFDLFVSKHRISYKNKILNILSPAGNEESIKVLYESWLRHNAKYFLIKRVNYLAAEFGFKIKNITMRGQKTRWGSCSSKGNLSFNFKLLQFRKEVIDYVIIHELCHLKEMNHSKIFWKLVQQHCPDYKSLKRELKSI